MSEKENNYGISPILLSKPDNEHWKTTIMLKKAREEATRIKSELDQQGNEEARWVGVPLWKRKLLEDKRQKKWDQEAPLREVKQKELEAEAKFRSLPGWKQKLIIDKQRRLSQI